MRNGQNKRMRGRNHRGKGGGHHHQNPLSRMYESNGPDVKIRGTAAHIGEKYLQLARDAQSSGDPIAAENYYQHAEHYFRLIAAAQEQYRQTQPYHPQQQGEMRGNSADEGYDDGEGEPSMGGEPFAPQQPSYYPRDSQPHQQTTNPQYQPQPYQPRSQQSAPEGDDDVERLPSFITGGQAPAQASPQHGPNGQNGSGGSNGYDSQGGDRFPLHRRRRRHRGPRDQAASAEGDAPSSSGSRQSED